ncbi:hypothetical protein BMS3Bbin07_01473 [bacterium BMS3Bbin07]|nr:hypothetical protein BMS3Bbin07_01473 [bacterium BMS3Bbin07]
MARKNQLADLRRLIALPPRDMRRQVSRYIYEDPNTVLRLLFRLIRTEKFTSQKKDNILTLTKFILDRHSPRPLPEWLINELKKVLSTENISDLDKAIILSAFEPEDLLESLEGFEDFVEEFTDFRDSFEDFIVDQIRSNPSKLYDIHKVIIEKSKPEGLLGMIEDLAGSEEPEVLCFLEHLTYHHDSDVSLSALRAIEMASTQDAINILYSVSCLNPLMKDEAERSYISLMQELPLAPEDMTFITDLSREGKNKYVDLWVSLIDGNGSMSAFIGKKFGRNNYFFASILMKLKVGIKDTIILTNLTKEGYNDIKREYFSELSYYPVKEDYLLKLIKHFMKKGFSNGFAIPLDTVILKNILGWQNIEPVEYMLETPDYKPLCYHPKDMFQFPFETWWMHEDNIYRLLKPYKGKQTCDIPDSLFHKIAEIFLDYARREAVPMCELCSDIIRNSSYSRRTKLRRLFLTIRNEILNPPETIFQSTFLNFGVVATIDHILHNLALGVDISEMIE